MSKKESKSDQTVEAQQTPEALEVDEAPSGGAETVEDGKEPTDDKGDESPVDEIETLALENKELRDKLLRTAAEFDNFRKRARRDVDDARKSAHTEVLRDILPVIDSLDLAISSVDPSGSADAIVEGVVMVRKQFLNATERHGLKPIETKGTAFDPNFHEAVAQVNSNEVDMGQVVEEVRKGYLLGERLLRAAMVVVSKGALAPAPDAPAEEPQEAPEEAIDEGEVEPQVDPTEGE